MTDTYVDTGYEDRAPGDPYGPRTTRGNTKVRPPPTEARVPRGIYSPDDPEAIPMPGWKMPGSAHVPLTDDEYARGEGDDAARAEYDAIKNAERGRKAEEANAAERDAAWQRFQERRRALDAEADRHLRSPHPSIPDPQKIGPAPSQQDYQKGAMEFLGAMALIAGFSGRLAWVPATAAVTAFGEAINGWKEGSQLKYENAMKQWDQNMRATLQNNAAALNKYQLILADRSLKGEEISQRMLLAANEFRDDEMYRRAKSGDIAAIGKWYDAQHNAQYGPAGAQQAYEWQKANFDRGELEKQEFSNKYGPRLLATDFIDPSTGVPYVDARTGQPMTEGKIAELRSLFERYPPGSVPSTLGGGGKASFEYQQWSREHPGKTMEDYWRAKAASRPPRNAPAIYMEKYLKEHPSATDEQVRRAMGIYNMTQSRMRALGTRSANIDIAIDEGIGTAKLAIQRSDEVPRGDWVPVNQIAERIRRGTSSVAQQRFDQANAALITAYAQTMSRSGTTTVHAQQRAEAVLLTATGPEAYREGVRQLLQEMYIVRDAVRDVISDRAGAPEGSTPDLGGAGGSTPGPADNPLGLRLP